MSKILKKEKLCRGTGLLLIEAINSNPNGDPDRESDPRIRQDGHGEISPVSFKHKIRALIEDKGSSLWKEDEILKEIGIDEKRFQNDFKILESGKTKREDVQQLSSDDFLSKYWDARVFGTTFLEEKNEQNGRLSIIRTGVVQFGLGVSLSPINIERSTTTKQLAVEDDKEKGMAPLGYRIVQYGLYAMPFFVNATMAHQTNCTTQDIELLLQTIPYAYKLNPSYIRSNVNIRHAYYVEHKKARGTFNDFEIIEKLTPKALLESNTPAKSWKDYDEKALNDSIKELNNKLKEKTNPIIDLIEYL